MSDDLFDDDFKALIAENQRIQAEHEAACTATPCDRFNRKIGRAHV